MSQGLDVQLACQLPLKSLGVQHVARELGEGSSIGDDKGAVQVQITASAAVGMECEDGKGEWVEKVESTDVENRV